jgi:hypothetical protein
VLINKPKTPECKHCGAFSDVAAVVYFDVDYGAHGDWRIMSSPATLAAFKEASDDPWFRQMGTVSWPPRVNQSNPKGPTQYGPDWKPGKSTESSPPEEHTGPGPEPQPEPPADQSGQADPASPSQDQTSEPAPSGQSDPGQSDPGQSDPGQSDPSQSDPSQSDPGQSSPPSQSDRTGQSDQAGSSDQKKAPDQGQDAGQGGQPSKGKNKSKGTRQSKKKG